MNEKEIRQFWEYMKMTPIIHPNWREGQAHMNALRAVAPILYDMITGTQADCFYRDASIPLFRETLGI